MITKEQLEEAIENHEYKHTDGIDHDMAVFQLLRQRIPYEKCPSIIIGADHDIIYLVEIDTVCECILPEDIEAVANRCHINDDECLAMFV